MQRSCADLATSNAKSFVRSGQRRVGRDPEYDMNDLGFMHMDAMVAWESYMERQPLGQ
jgi:hypothetical protein